MPRLRSNPRLAPTAALCLALLPGAAAAQEALPLEELVSGSVPSGDVAAYRVDVAGPGFLTVVVRTDGGQDVAFHVTDETGQPLLDGSADVDLGGDLGAEQLVVALPRAGSYGLLVEDLGFSGPAFRAVATFLPSELAEAPEDPDGRPDRARAIEVGESVDDGLDPAAGDTRDWYRFEVREAGVLTILTRGEDDIRLEHFVEGDRYIEPEQSSDQDLDGSYGNESLTLDVDPGDAVLVRVSPVGSASAIRYRIASGLIPGAEG